MDANLKTKWVEALRSGKYKQGFEALRLEQPGGPRYCCLGVLCDIAKDVTWGAPDEDGCRAAIHEGSQKVYSLPDALRHQAQIDHKEHKNLTSMNDGGKRFSTIASYIEKHL